MSSGERMVTVRLGSIMVAVHGLRRVSSYLPPGTGAADDLEGSISILDQVLYGALGRPGPPGDQATGTGQPASVDRLNSRGHKLEYEYEAALRGCRHALFLVRRLRGQLGSKNVARETALIIDVLSAACWTGDGGA